MKQSTKTTNRAFMHNNIPYRYCYEEGGMIEIEKDIYTGSYEIVPPNKEMKGSYNSKMTKMIMEEILQKLAEKFSFQFTIRNRYRDKEEYLASVMIDEKGAGDAYSHLKNLYNNVLQENCDIGHNNFAHTVYLTITTEAHTPEQALEIFAEADTWIKEVFYSLYGFQARAMTLEERLELLHDIYHPGAHNEEFGAKVDYDGKGFSIKSMQRMNMDTKDVIAPEYYDCKSRDYMRVGNFYVRTYFINSIPENISDSVLLDLASVSSNSVLSIHYEQVDEELGFQVAAKHVKDNTEVKNIPVRDTVQDRKEHRVRRQERAVRQNEEEYFYQSALNMFKRAKSQSHTLLQASFVITLFAESMEELERDSKLLRVSASKYVCQIRCLDLQQNEGFQSMLPLNNLKVNVKRMFQVEQMAVMQPLCSQSIYEKELMFYGLNSINDNFVLMDRSNFPTAMIAGVENSGKTFSVKREAANTLLGTDDEVVILTNNPREYHSFARNFHGHIIGEFHPDIFSKDNNYNLDKDKKILQRRFMAAYLISKLGFHRTCPSNELLQSYYEQAEKEAEILAEFSSLNEALLYAKDHPVELQLFVKSIENLSFHEDVLNGRDRLTIMGYKKEDELLAQLDYLWNYAVQRKKKNSTVWIFVDSVDELIYSTTGSDYLISLLESADVLKTPITLVVEDAVHIVTNQRAVIEFEYLLDKIRCFRLFSLNPVERKKFVEKLNISRQLIPYFVDRSAGEGVLITPSFSVAFNDRFADKEDEFYRLFV